MTTVANAVTTDLAICVKNLSKCYEIYNSPRDRLKQFIIPRINQIFRQTIRKYFRDFWALTDVSFEVRKGETVGIIGRNGAGKSTLLQIICGTLTPTQGSVQINGRVAALLELGSGFNSEFTGRENIYMNASVLGLTKDEIDFRFDKIVEFADIGDFLDQPVKMYSSGMYVRLAFAVVVHVDADILIVDEALSVGDTYFQSKCMLKMKQMMNSGVTVLFVSHDVAAVKALCKKAVYLANGKVVAAGNTDEVVEAYYGAGVRSVQKISPKSDKLISLISAKEQQEFSDRASFHRLKNGMAEFLNIELLDENNNRIKIVEFGQPVVLRMIAKARIDINLVSLAYHIRDKNGFDIIYSDTELERCHITNFQKDEIVTMEWKFTTNIQEGNYTIAAMLSIPQDLSIGKVEVCDFVPIGLNFQVTRGQSSPIYAAVYWANQVSQSRTVFKE